VLGELAQHRWVGSDGVGRVEHDFLLTVVG
jgi:hypothetical protein